MLHGGERGVLRDAVAWTLIVAGLLWLLKGLELLADVESVPGSYLGAVFARSLANGFQFGLLAAVLAVPLHASWVLLRPGRRDRGEVARDYDGFGLLAQTLFTSFGFMGTIVGVSIAVAGLEAAMQDGDPAVLVSGLSTAFDTTFLGLSGAILLMVLRRLALSGGGSDQAA